MLWPAAMIFWIDSSSPPFGPVVGSPRLNQSDQSQVIIPEQFGAVGLVVASGVVETVVVVGDAVVVMVVVVVDVVTVTSVSVLGTGVVFVVGEVVEGVVGIVVVVGAVVVGVVVTTGLVIGGAVVVIEGVVVVVIGRQVQHLTRIS